MVCNNILYNTTSTNEVRCDYINILGRKKELGADYINILRKDKKCSRLLREIGILRVENQPPHLLN